MTQTDLPDGFKQFSGPDGLFIAQNGPLYLREHDGRFQIGFRVEERHANPMKICHGGMLSTFCDMLLPLTAIRTVPELKNRFLPTISLQMDFVAPAPVGSWVQGVAEAVRTTRSMVFMQGLVTADGTTIVRTSGIFKIGSEYRRD